MNQVRLNKALADAGVCSRRKADDLIRSGRVSVNGLVVLEMGLRIDPAKDAVALDGRPVDLAPAGQEQAYFMLNKPVQVVSTAHDPQGRTTVLDLLPPQMRGKRLYPVGRLDFFSEGLLLLTNDGELTLRLTHPRYHLPRVYVVRLRQKPGKEALESMRRGMTLAEGEKLAPVGVALKEDGRTLTLTLHQGLNRQIRRMCRDLNLTILTLTRVSIGPLHLGDLAKGACRPLQADELAALKKAVGLP